MLIIFISYIPIRSGPYLQAYKPYINLCLLQRRWPGQLLPGTQTFGDTPGDLFSPVPTPIICDQIFVGMRIFINDINQIRIILRTSKIKISPQGCPNV